MKKIASILLAIVLCSVVLVASADSLTHFGINVPSDWISMSSQEVDFGYGTTMADVYQTGSGMIFCMDMDLVGLMFGSSPSALLASQMRDNSMVPDTLTGAISEFDNPSEVMYAASGIAYATCATQGFPVLVAGDNGYMFMLLALTSSSVDLPALAELLYIK